MFNSVKPLCVTYHRKVKIICLSNLIKNTTQNKPFIKIGNRCHYPNNNDFFCKKLFSILFVPYLNSIFNDAIPHSSKPIVQFSWCNSSIKFSSCFLLKKFSALPNIWSLICRFFLIFANYTYFARFCKLSVILQVSCKSLA